MSADKGRGEPGSGGPHKPVQGGSTPPPATSAKQRGRGRPPIAEAIVEKLEQSGDVPTADKVRGVAGLPKRKLTRDEDFIATVQKLVTGHPVGFHAASEDEAAHWAQLARELPNDRHGYRATVKGTRVEVGLASG